MAPQPYGKILPPGRSSRGGPAHSRTRKGTDQADPAQGVRSRIALLRPLSFCPTCGVKPTDREASTENEVEADGVPHTLIRDSQRHKSAIPPPWAQYCVMRPGANERVLKTRDLLSLDARVAEYYLDRCGFGHARSALRDATHAPAASSGRISSARWPEFCPLNNQLGGHSFSHRLMMANLEAYAQTALGIVVSIALFLVGYRQTIGARKERALAANVSLQRALLRRLVLEDYRPSTADMVRLIDGKAREFRVSQTDLLQPEQVLITLFTEVFDSDLISPPQRRDLEQTLRVSLEDYRKAAVEEKTMLTGQTAPGDDADSLRYVAALTIATALVGTIASLLPQVIAVSL